MPEFFKTDFICVSCAENRYKVSFVYHLLLVRYEDRRTSELYNTLIINLIFEFNKNKRISYFSLL